MTTSRKITLAMSYLRSAARDVFVSSPTLAHRYFEIVRWLGDTRSIRKDITGKCYNIPLI